MLEAVQKKLGMVPNLFKTLAHAPAALQFYLAGSEALAGSTLATALREQIALATAGANACDYCASAHTLMGKGAGLAAGELSDNLRGRSGNARTQVALDLVRAIVHERGQVSDAQLQSARDAGFTDTEIVEIVALVSLNLFTNYFNHVASTTIDFPAVRTRDAVAA